MKTWTYSEARQRLTAIVREEREKAGERLMDVLSGDRPPSPPARPSSGKASRGSADAPVKRKR